MRFVTIPDSEVWDSGTRATVGAPEGREDVVRPLEVVVDFVELAGQECRRYNMRVELEPGDLEALTQDGHLWFSLLGAQIPPVSVGLLPEGIHARRG